jgi:hypothetical protein
VPAAAITSPFVFGMFPKKDSSRREALKSIAEFANFSFSELDLGQKHTQVLALSPFKKDSFRPTT